jgi:HD-like signal output (HDOD) protein
MTLDQLLNNPGLPSIPEALLKLNDLIKRTRPVAEITAVIERDPGLATRSLELANSAWYKRSRTIATVKDAINTIGLDTLHQLVFATSVIRTFHGINQDAANMRKFWTQSLQLACHAKIIKETIGDKTPVHIFTSGLVTYIGKLVIYMNIAEQAQKILENSLPHPERQHEEEIKILGFSHADVSAGLLKKWDIPQIIYLPIQYYTQPLSAPADRITDSAALCVAHHLVFKQAEDLDAENATNGLMDALNALNLTQIQLPAIQQQGSNELSQAGTIVGITAV